MNTHSDQPTIPTDLLHHIAERFAERFLGVFSPETVERYIVESYGQLRAELRFTLTCRC